MGLNETDIKIIVLVVFVIWFKLLYMSLDVKSLLCVALLMFPGFPLMLIVINLTWGPTFGEWLKAAG